MGSASPVIHHQAQHGMAVQAVQEEQGTNNQPVHPHHEDMEPTGHLQPLLANNGTSSLAPAAEKHEEGVVHEAATTQQQNAPTTAVDTQSVIASSTTQETNSSVTDANSSSTFAKSPAAIVSKIAYKQLLTRAMKMIWPEDPWLRVRVIVCLGLLVWSRLVNMLIPQLYKLAVDALQQTKNTGTTGPGQMPTSPVSGSAHVPNFMHTISSLFTRNRTEWMIFAYVGLKLFVGLQGDLKNLIFTPVANHIQITVQLAVFRHLHALSHR